MVRWIPRPRILSNIEKLVALGSVGGEVIPLAPKLDELLHFQVKMDRHHLLVLLDKIQEKYEIQDGEYKEFAEAIGGKKAIPEFKVGAMVKVDYDHIGMRADFGDDEVYPVVNVTDKCSRIWKVVEDAHERHVHNYRHIGWSLDLSLIHI